MIGVAVNGDVLDINCWSNIPYYFFTTGKKAGLFQNPFRLDHSKLAVAQKVWNLMRLLTGHGVGGYQYSKAFLMVAEAQIPAEYFKEQVISFNQVFPRATTVKEFGGEIYYYIDSTLYDLFRDKSYHFKLSEEVKEEALQIEKENYTLATRIVTMGSWVRKSLQNYYGVSEEKISTILPGANLILPKNYVRPCWRPGAGLKRDFILGFVGKDWERKGLPLVISLKNALKSRGFKVKINVIGKAPEALAFNEDINYSGFINKQFQMDEFIQKLSACDIGCLFSKGEALGISTLEFIRVGIPVTGFFHQGLLDTLMPDVSLRFGINDDFETIVDRFDAYLYNEEEQKSQFKAIEKYAELVTWENCIQHWRNLLQEDSLSTP